MTHDYRTCSVCIRAPLLGSELDIAGAHGCIGLPPTHTMDFMKSELERKRKEAASRNADSAGAPAVAVSAAGKKYVRRGDMVAAAKPVTAAAAAAGGVALPAVGDDGGNDHAVSKRARTEEPGAGGNAGDSSLPFSPGPTSEVVEVDAGADHDGAAPEVAAAAAVPSTLVDAHTLSGPDGGAAAAAAGSDDDDDDDDDADSDKEGGGGGRSKGGSGRGRGGAADRARTVSTDAGAYKGRDPYKYVYKYFKGLLNEWEVVLSLRPLEEVDTPEGRATARMVRATGGDWMGAVIEACV